MAERHIIGVDLGGTQIRACLADERASILCETRRPTLAREGPQAVLARISEAIREVLGDVEAKAVLGIGIGAPGPLDPYTGAVVNPPNLPGWHNVPLRDIMEREFGLRVYVNNDANLAGLAEQRFGAGRGCADVVYLTIGTGIGGGFVCGGRLLLGAHGYAGEPGHMTIEPSGPRCNCGNIGCLEALAAGPAIARRALELARRGEQSSLSAALESGMELSAEMVGTAAQQGDGVAQQAVQQAAYYLGVGVLNLINLFDPDVVVVGGGVSKLGPLLFEPVRALVQERGITPVQRGTPILPAALGDQAGLLGAVAWVMAKAAEDQPLGGQAALPML